MSKNMKIAIAIILLSVLLVTAIVVPVVLIAENNKKPYDKLIILDFVETASKFNFTESEKTNINNVLAQNYNVDGNIAGFSAFESQVTLSDFHAIEQCAKYSGNESLLNELNNKFKNVNIDVKSLSMSNLYYYLAVCKDFHINVNENAVDLMLENNYDEASGLFNLHGNNDTQTNRLWISYSIFPYMTERQKTKFNIRNSVLRIYNDFELLSPSKKDTLYNSGGDIIYAMDICGLNDKIGSKNGVQEWYNAWKAEYDKTEITNLETAYSYASFADIAKIFNDNDASNKLTAYFNESDANTVDVNIEPVFLAHLLKNHSTIMNNRLKERINDYVQQESQTVVVERKNFDIAYTYYGVCIAEYSDFEVDKQKISNFLNTMKESMTKNKSYTEIARFLNYYVKIYKIIENYTNDCDFATVKSLLNTVFDSITFSDETLIQDVVACRQCLEVVSFLNILTARSAYNMGIFISNKHANKIIRFLEKVDKEKFNNIYFIDLAICGEILRNSVYDKSEILNICESLRNDDNGFCYDGKSDSELYSSFFEHFLGYNYNINDYRYTDALKEYADSLKESDGIYKMSRNDNATIQSIYYGNAIAKFTLGGGNKNAE